MTTEPNGKSAINTRNASQLTAPERKRRSPTGGSMFAGTKFVGLAPSINHGRRPLLRTSVCGEKGKCQAFAISRD